MKRFLLGQSDCSLVVAFGSSVLVEPSVLRAADGHRCDGRRGHRHRYRVPDAEVSAANEDRTAKHRKRGGSDRIRHSQGTAMFGFIS